MNAVLTILFAVFTICFWCPVTLAAVVPAASCSRADVQAAIDTAVNGDTVRIPAGEAEWDGKVSIPAGKRIVLSGAGSAQTSIKSNFANEAVNVASGSRITGMGFLFLNTDGYGIAVRAKGWRVDQCKFQNANTPTVSGVFPYGFSYDGQPVGVVDHCEFIEARVNITADMSLLAHKIWNEPLGLGTNNAVFIEDCVFTRTHGNAVDGNYGCRYVFRHNILNDCYIEAHSIQQEGNRAARSWEIYHNRINQVQVNMWVPFFLRGGTGVAFNNSITGSKWSELSIGLDNVRCYEAYPFPPGKCDGSSLYDGNEEANGYPCRDQIGRSRDQSLWTDANPYPSQELDPAYFWNNKHGAVDIVPKVLNNSGIHIKENRDYYVGSGKPGYAPYPYPHPLSVQDESGRLLNLHKATGTGSIQLHWDAVNGATGYGVSRNWQAIIPVAGTAYTDPAPAPVYIVYACDSTGKIIAMEGVNSDDQAPDVPANLHAAAVTCDSISLAWEAATDNVAVIGYRVYQNDNPAAAANTSGLTATIGGLSPATQYSLQVAAYDAAGNESAKSAAVSVTTNAGFAVSGRVTLNGAGLANVIMSGLPSSITTDSNGYYTAWVDPGWDGAVTPTLSEYTFAPASITYSDVIENQVQNYIATKNSGGSAVNNLGGGGGSGCFIDSFAPRPALRSLFFMIISWPRSVPGRVAAEIRQA